MRKPSTRRSSLDIDSVTAKIRCLMLDDFNDTHAVDEHYSFFVSRQMSGLLKKFKSSSDPDSIDTRAVAFEKFLAVADHLRDFDLDLDNVPLRPGSSGNENFRGSVLRKARSFVLQVLGPRPEMDEWFSACKHGPNSSIGISYADTGNSRKWVFPLSCSDDCAPYADMYYRWDSTLRESLQRAFPDANLRSGLRPHLVYHNSSKLTTVPKTNEIDRTIAVEPTLNMFFQQGLGAVLEDRFKKFGIDFEVQQYHHKKVAAEASVTRNWATIDFSSASDCVSTKLLKFLLPPIWFKVLDDVRTKTVLIGQVRHSLPCFATMGNSTTFPLETLVFWSLAVAVDSMNRSPFSSLVEYESLGSCSVFGDDCLVRTHLADRFISICESCGFIVNKEKSFTKVDCDFRESCGADYKSFRNVRPFYIRRPRSNKPSVVKAWLYTLWNGILKKYILCFGSLRYIYHDRVLRYLATLIHATGEVFLVADHDPDDSGIKFMGDYLRVKRLFPHDTRFSPLRADRHGTFTYRKLISVPMEKGTNFDELEYWYSIKHRASSCNSFHVLSTFLRSERSFQVLKRDRGYVVANGLDTTGAFAMIL